MRKILIVGAGKMGRWFANYFSSKGYDVRICDVNRRKAEEVAREVKGKAVEGLRDEEMVLCAVNLRNASRIAEDFSNKGFKGLYIDISSLKKGVNSVLRKGRMIALSIHPLFGPGAKSIEGKKIALTPIVDAETELEMAKKLFEKARFIIVDEEEHDRTIAYVIQLPQLLSLLASKVLKDEKFMLFEGTSFSMLKMMVAVSLYQSEELVKELLELNPYVEEVIGELKKGVKEIDRGKVNIGDFKWMSLKNEYEKAYRCFEA